MDSFSTTLNRFKILNFVTILEEAAAPLPTTRCGGRVIAFKWPGTTLFPDSFHYPSTFSPFCFIFFHFPFFLFLFFILILSLDFSYPRHHLPFYHKFYFSPHNTQARASNGVSKVDRLCRVQKRSCKFAGNAFFFSITTFRPHPPVPMYVIQ